MGYVARRDYRIVVRQEWYTPLGLDGPNTTAIVDKFVQTLVKTNRTYDFFVDWAKVTRNQAHFQIALSEIEKCRHEANLREALVKLLVRNPPVASVFPLLLAWREDEWRILDLGADGSSQVRLYDFSGKSGYNESEATVIVDFLEKTGLLGHLNDVSDLASYYLGVEVGLDTNARKNRSGLFMEHAITSHIRKAAPAKEGWKVLSQVGARSLPPGFGDLSTKLSSRRFDYILLREKRKIDLEVNYFNQLGSKPQEIVDSYINRAEELRICGWDLIWVTDGPGWKAGGPQIHKAFDSLDAVLNLEFCRLGILDKILYSHERS